MVDRPRGLRPPDAVAAWLSRHGAPSERGHEVLEARRTSALGDFEHGLDDEQRLRVIQSLSTRARHALLEGVAAPVRDRLLGASGVYDVHVHRRGVAFDYDWSQLAAADRAYNPKNAWAMAAASTRAYETFDRTTDPSTVPGLRSLMDAGFTVRPFGAAAQSTQGFVAWRGSSVIVAFRGTQPGDAADAMADADFKPVGIGDGKAHRGFVGALDQAWPEVAAALAQARAERPPEPLQVQLTGHSLGAALATLAAIRLSSDAGVSVNGLYTFGSPRVLDRGAAEAFERAGLGERAWRFVNNADGVTGLPPQGDILGYRHVGTLLYFDRIGRLHASPSDAFVMADWRAAFTQDAYPKKLAGRRGEIESVWDHGMPGYTKHVFINRDVPLVR